MKRYVEKKGKKYILTFDEYGILDTVVLKDKPETLISTKNRDVQFFVNNQEIIDLTPIGCGCGQRGNEIHKWLGDNSDIIGEESNNYIILDDDSDMLYWQRNNFVNVDQYVGLTPKQVYKATRFLTGKGQV